MRTVTGIASEGSGLRVTWSDGSVDQFVWSFINNRLTLTLDGQLCPPSTVQDIIAQIKKCNQGTALWSHLFGVSADHLSASADGQIGDALTANTWTRLIFDNTQIESQNPPETNGGGGISVDESTGIITLPLGTEWKIDATVLAHDTSTTLGFLGIQLYNETDEEEVPYSFTAGTSIALANNPRSLQTSTILDIGDSLVPVEISVRVRSSLATSILGLNAATVPTGSQNYAGVVQATRIG